MPPRPGGAARSRRTPGATSIVDHELGRLDDLAAELPRRRRSPASPATCSTTWGSRATPTTTATPELAARRGARPPPRHPDHAGRGGDRGGPAARASTWSASGCPGTSSCARPPTPTVFVDPFHRSVLDRDGLREAVLDRSTATRRGSRTATSTRSDPGDRRPHAHQPPAVVRRPAATGPAALWAQCLRVLVPGTTGAATAANWPAMLAANGRFDAAAIELDAIADRGRGRPRPSRRPGHARQAQLRRPERAICLRARSTDGTRPGCARIGDVIDRDLKRSLGQMMKGVQVVGAAHGGWCAAYMQPLGLPGQLRGAGPDGVGVAASTTPTR